VNRLELLQRLESVAPGLATRETVEQSSCFVFKDKRLITYNGDLACRAKCPAEWSGAVAADKLITLLQKLVEEEIDITTGDGELLVKGKGRRAGIRMEGTITLPVDAVERPGEWHELPEAFGDAVDICVQCTSKDDTQGFYRACIHLHPEYIEACDNLQMARYPLATGVTRSTLLKRDSVRHIAKLGMTHLSETENWLHFGNPAGTVLSCRKYLEVDFPKLDAVLATTGTPATLPGGLAEAVDKAQVFSNNGDTDSVMIALRADKLSITGRSPTGWYEERKTIKYAGPPLAFFISPKMLTEIARRHNEVEIGPDQFGVPGKRLRVATPRYTYISCLTTTEENNGGGNNKPATSKETGGDV
jgi:hypothetical protein